MIVSEAWDTKTGGTITPGKLEKIKTVLGRYPTNMEMRLLWRVGNALKRELMMPETNQISILGLDLQPWRFFKALEADGYLMVIDSPEELKGRKHPFRIIIQSEALMNTLVDFVSEERKSEDDYKAIR